MTETGIVTLTVIPIAWYTIHKGIPMNTIYPITTMKNNLKVVSHTMAHKESVALAVWLKVGGRDETKRISGISHYIEHLIFKGTALRNARRIKEEIEGRGGVLNGFTSEDTTCFLVKIVKDHFPLAVKILSDMVQNPLFSKHDIERERTVILEEIKMYMDMPMHFAHDLINQLLWPDQPLGMFVAGDLHSVSNISEKDIVAFHKKYYRPSNALFSVCGDISHDDILDEVGKNFSRKSSGGAIPFVKARLNQKGPRFLFQQKETEQAHLVLGVPALKRADPKRYALALLHVILGANMSSRLYEEVREKRGLAYEIRSGISFYADTGSFTVSAGVENKKVEETLAVITKQLVKIKQKQVTHGELKRAKEYFLNQLFFALEDTLDHMLWVGDKALHFSTIATKELIRKRIESVTRDDILTLANKLFKTSKINLVSIGKIDDARQKRIKNIIAC